MLTISGSKALYLASLLLLQLAALSPVDGLPAGHHGLQHGSRHTHGTRAPPPLAVPNHEDRHTYLRRRRNSLPHVSSNQRMTASPVPYIHHIDERFLPSDLSPVQHVVLAKRHRDHKSHKSDNDDEEDEEESGHDENGYDDGSWRGSDGDYGSKGKKDKGEDDAEDDDDKSSSIKEGRIKASKHTDDEVAASDEAEEDDAESTGDGDSAEKEDDKDKYFKPNGRIKAKSGNDAPKTAEKGDAGNEESTEGEADDTTSASASASGKADKTSAVESDEPLATPTAKVKAVKSSKTSDSEEEDGSDEEGAERPFSSSKTTRASDHGPDDAQGECAALKKVYDDMGGSDWTSQDGWTDLGEKCCSAYGVSCNDAGKISALDLPSNGLSGTVSASLFELKSLTRLNLTGNAISGSLPDKFDNLAHLTTLYLDQNQLSGEIPGTLQNSSSLWSIHLNNNTLDGMLYFPNAYNLTQLYASRNKFTYLNIEANTALVKVVLDDNNFNSTLPDMQSFTDLQTFSVARNSFTGDPFDVTNLSQLVKLDLQHNKLTGPFPDVTKLPNLQTLSLIGNDLSGHFPTGTAPSSLTVCRIDPVLTSSCPSSSVLKDPDSLAAVCQLKCRGGGKPVNAAAAAKEDGDAKGPPAKGRSRTAAGQEGSTVEGDDSGQTPASLAAAYTSAASSSKHPVALVYAVLALSAVMAFSAL